jgi:putative tryptophan/tyrosine transport system substrate-binding protein
MRRMVTSRLTVFAVAVTALTAPVAAKAQPATKVYRIGVLANALETADGLPFQAFLDTLRTFGYVPDRNIVIEWRSSEADPDRLPGLAAELVRSKVDIILATALQPARAAAEATKTIPIVFVILADPVGQGLVDSPARPGGNITGLATYVREESSERILELLRAALPRLSRVAVLTNPVNPVHKELMSQALPSAAQRMTLLLLPLEVRSPNDLQGAFDTVVRERADALYVLGDALAFILRARIVDFAAKNRLPAIYTSRGAVEAGGLISYGPNLRDLFRRAASYVDKILRGVKPGDLSIEQSAKFELVVNLRTAKALGLSMSPSLLQRADDVIQ